MHKLWLFKSPTMGSPTSYSVFMDEEYNRQVACIARGAHAQVLETRVLDNFAWAQRDMQVIEKVEEEMLLRKSLRLTVP